MIERRKENRHVAFERRRKLQPEEEDTSTVFTPITAAEIVSDAFSSDSSSTPDTSTPDTSTFDGFNGGDTGGGGAGGSW